LAYGKQSSGSKEQASKFEQLLIWLREDIIGEFDAINQYQYHIDNIDDPEVKELLEHIRDEEKEHVAELTHLLARLDAIQGQKFAEDHTVDEEHRVVSEAGPATTTVGSMFGVNK